MYMYINETSGIIALYIIAFNWHLLFDTYW